MRKNLRVLITFFSFFTLACSGRVLIFTYSYNRPDFIEIQHKTFKKFLLDDYDFIVFNDASNESMANEIDHMCKTLEISCKRIPQEIHSNSFDASQRNCRVVQYSLETLGFTHNDIVALFDSDMFLIKEFSIRNYLKDFDVAGCAQSREHINYLWIALIFLNMATMPNKTTINFSCGTIDNIHIDSGGYSYYYLKENPQAKINYLEETLYLKDFFCSFCMEKNLKRCEHSISRMKSLEFSNALIDLTSCSPQSIMELYLKNTILHYRAGSNWNNESKEYHEQKTQLLLDFITRLLRD